MTVYEKSFDSNEWFVLISLVLSSILIWIFPKIFSPLERIAHTVYGVFVGMFFDHTISIRPWDFYDVNDSSAYQWIDFLSYLNYGPFSYFFIYFYVKLSIKGFLNILYVFIWTFIAVLIEWIGTKIGLFHYEKGFETYWSISIYFFVQSVQIGYYHIINKLNYIS